jgi:hypothetical protein
MFPRIVRHLAVEIINSDDLVASKLDIFVRQIDVFAHTRYRRTPFIQRQYPLLRSVNEDYAFLSRVEFHNCLSSFGLARRGPWPEFDAKAKHHSCRSGAALTRCLRWLDPRQTRIVASAPRVGPALHKGCCRCLFPSQPGLVCISCGVEVSCLLSHQRDADVGLYRK